MKKFYALLTMSFLASVSLIGQEIASVDFESEVTVTTGGQFTFEIIDNPKKTGLNTTSKCGQIGRTNETWWAYVDIPLEFSIPANEKRYVHMMVLYADQPHISMRLNNVNTDYDPVEFYTELGEWQDLVWEFEGGADGKDVTQIRILADAGFSNNPAGFVLNNTDKFGLIDEIIVNESAEPRTTISTSVQKELADKNYTLTASNGSIRFFMNDQTTSQVDIFDIRGVLIKSFRQNAFEYVVPVSGLYFVRIGNTTEKVLVK